MLPVVGIFRKSKAWCQASAKRNRRQGCDRRAGAHRSFSPPLQLNGEPTKETSLILEIELGNISFHSSCFMTSIVQAQLEVSINPNL